MNTLRFHQLCNWLLWNFHYFHQISHYFSTTRTFLHFFLNEGGNTWTRGEFGQFAEFFLFKVPKPRYPSDANSRQRDKESLNSSTQAKPSPAWGAAQARCRSAALPSDYITTPVALVQHYSTEEQQAAASAAGKLRSISLVCRLHNTITLHLTAVKSKSRASVKFKSKVSVNIHILHRFLFQ